MKMLRIGSRGSDLALWQARHVANLIQTATGTSSEIVVIQTLSDLKPDQPISPDDWPTGGFTSAVEEALASKAVDVAVHSLKDLPTQLHPALDIAATPERGPVHDVLIAREKEIELALQETLEGRPSPCHLCIGTSSPRRAWQAERYLNSQASPIRGNVPTRIAKLMAGQYDAICLAAAGIERLGLDLKHRIDLPIDRFPTAPGQGALAVQTRRDDDAEKIVSTLNHLATNLCVRAEREFLSAMNAGCHAPLAATATYDGTTIRLHVQYRLKQGSIFEDTTQGLVPEELAHELAKRVLYTESKS